MGFIPTRTQDQSQRQTMDIDQFRHKVHVDPTTFNGIIKKIHDHHIFHNNLHVPQIPVETQLAIFLYCARHYASAKINISYFILFNLTTSYSSYFGGKKGISRNKTSFFLLMGSVGMWCCFLEGWYCWGPGGDGGLIVSISDIVVCGCLDDFGFGSGSPEVIWDVDINGEDWWGSGFVDDW